MTRRSWVESRFDRDLSEYRVVTGWTGSKQSIEIYVVQVWIEVIQERSTDPHSDGLLIFRWRGEMTNRPTISQKLPRSLIRVDHFERTVSFSSCPALMHGLFWALVPFPGINSQATDAWMLLARLIPLLGLVALSRTSASDIANSKDDIYEESLVFRPLADGKLSVLFRFHTKAHDGKSSH